MDINNSEYAFEFICEVCDSPELDLEKMECSTCGSRIKGIQENDNGVEVIRFYVRMEDSFNLSDDIDIEIDEESPSWEFADIED